MTEKILTEEVLTSLEKSFDLISSRIYRCIDDILSGNCKTAGVSKLQLALEEMTNVKKIVGIHQRKVSEDGICEDQ